MFPTVTLRKEVAAEIVIYSKSICAGPRLSATLPVCRSRSLMGIWPIGRRKGMPSSAPLPRSRRYLCQVRADEYWPIEHIKSFDEFLKRRFPESRRKAYYLMSIHEQLSPKMRRELKGTEPCPQRNRSFQVQWRS